MTRRQRRTQTLRRSRTRSRRAAAEPRGGPVRQPLSARRSLSGRCAGAPLVGLRRLPVAQERLCRIHIERAGEEEALAAVALVAQARELLERSSIPSARVSSPRALPSWTRVWSSGRHSGFGEPRDERPVDLQGVDREALEIGERGVAGAEVVNRNLHPEVLQDKRRWAVSSTSRMSVVSVISRVSAAGSRPMSARASSDEIDEIVGVGCAPETSRPIDDHPARSRRQVATGGTPRWRTRRPTSTIIPVSSKSGNEVSRVQEATCRCAATEAAPRNPVGFISSRSKMGW